MSTSTAAKLTATQTAVVDLLAAGPMIPLRIAEALDSKMVAVRSVTKSLAKRGLIVQDPETTEWSLVGSTTEVTPEPVESTVVLTETLETALAAARERIEAGRETEVVTSKAGDYVKSARAGSAWITTDGQFICAKGTLEGTDKEPWALYRVGETLTFVGTFKTSSTPFLVATQAPYRD